MSLARISLTVSATRPYHPSLSVGLPYYIMYQYRAVVDRFSLVALSLLVCVKGPLEFIAYKFALTYKGPACLVRLIWIVFEKDCRCLYSCCFVGCCLQELFNTTRSILVQFPSSFLYIGFVSVHVVHPYRSIDTTADWKKKLRFILSFRSDFYMKNSLSIVVQAFASRALMSFLIDEKSLPILQNLSTILRDLSFSMDMLPLWLKHTNPVSSALTWRLMPPAARSRQWDWAWAGVFKDTGWNDKIVALEKTIWFHFRLMKTGFLFLLQTIY